jgi:hypothetical protein
MMGRLLKKRFEVPREYKKTEAAFEKKKILRKQAYSIETVGRTD